MTGGGADCVGCIGSIVSAPGLADFRRAFLISRELVAEPRRVHARPARVLRWGLGVPACCLSACCPREGERRPSVRVPPAARWTKKRGVALNCKTKCDKEEITFHADLFMP